METHRDEYLKSIERDLTESEDPFKMTLPQLVINYVRYATRYEQLEANYSTDSNKEDQERIRHAKEILASRKSSIESRLSARLRG